MLSKKNIDEIKRNERAKKKARFLEKKIKVTRRVILARIGKFNFDIDKAGLRRVWRPIKYKAIVYLRRKRNNIYLTLTDLKGKVVTTSTSGFVGYKSFHRTFPNAAQASAKRIYFYLKTANINEIAVVIKTKVSSLVYAVVRGFTALGVKVVRIMDRIPIAHNGVKKKKARRK